MYVKQSYADEFEHFMLDMKDKYPKSIFELNGISEDDLDHTKFAQKYFTKRNVADISSDSNANVQIKNIAAFIGERHKGGDKMDSLFLFWKTARKQYGLRESNRLVESELNKDINIQDASNFFLPYSYYSQTPLFIKINNVVKYWTMKQLYDQFEPFAQYDEVTDTYKIKTENIRGTYDYNASFMTQYNYKSLCDTGSICPYLGDVTEKITVEILDKGVWIALKQIIKHKHEEEKDFIVYETHNGDFAFVTEDHPVILADKSEKLAKDLLYTDEVIQEDPYTLYEPTITVPEDVAYITGFILGDGNLHSYSYNHYYIQHSKKLNVTPKLRLCRGGNTIMVYQKDIKNSCIYKKLNNTFPDIKYYTLGSDGENTLGFTSQAYSLLYGDYFNCGIHSNSYTKRLPENILAWEEKSFFALLGGLIDSDGSISQGRVDICVASYAIVNQLYDVLKMHKFNGVFKKLRTDENPLGNNFYFTITFRADERLLGFCEKIDKLDPTNFKYNKNMDTTIRNNTLRKIHRFKKSDISKKSFLYKELEDVYDVTTATGTFTANGMLQHNCWAFDTYDLYTIGLPFVTNYPSDPAKHSDVFWQHTIQLLQYAAPQMMGATAIPNFIVIYSGLLKQDSEDDEYPIPSYTTQVKLFERYVKQRFQEMIFALNQPLRQVQSTFTNITIFDSMFMKEICSKYLIRDTLIDPTFAMYIQKLFLETLNTLNDKKIATFPILTAQFKKNEKGDIEDEDFLDLISQINLPTGHLNLFNDTNLNALSSCCRLVNNVEDILEATKNEYMNLIGGSSIKVGSIGVTTLPLVRVALKAKKDEEEFFKILTATAIDCYKVNHCRRILISEKIDQDQMPLYSYGFINLKNQYSTLGINGFYECLNFMGYNIFSPEGIAFGKKILIRLDEITKSKIKKYNYRVNMEQIPAEQTSSKLAKADAILYNQTEFYIYANQFIPLSMEASLFDRIRIQAELEKYFSGGTILHANFVEKIPTKLMMKNFIKKVVKSGVKYFAVNYFFNICENDHCTVSTKDICEKCGGTIVDKMSRIVGFLVPLSSWSKERRQEFVDRKKYNLNSLKD